MKDFNIKLCNTNWKLFNATNVRIFIHTINRWRAGKLPVVDGDPGDLVTHQHHGVWPYQHIHHQLLVPRVLLEHSEATHTSIKCLRILDYFVLDFFILDFYLVPNWTHAAKVGWLNSSHGLNMTWQRPHWTRTYSYKSCCIADNALVEELK